MIFFKKATKFEVKGFTLIEVLIGLTLLSIMVVLLFASLKICADSWEKGEKKVASVNDMAVVYHFFQKHFFIIFPSTVGPHSLKLHQGQEHRLSDNRTFGRSLCSFLRQDSGWPDTVFVQVLIEQPHRLIPA